MCRQRGLPIVPQGITPACPAPVCRTTGRCCCDAAEPRAARLDALNNINDRGGWILQNHQDMRDANRLFRCRWARKVNARLVAICRPIPVAWRCWATQCARSLSSGSEVVTADGGIHLACAAVRRDNTGYDLRDLLLALEGTLASSPRRR